MSSAETFADELRRIARTPEAAERFVDSWRGRTICLSARGLTVYRLRAAVAMLASGMTRAEARAALMARYAVSRRTAYRVLEIAIRYPPA